MNRVAEGLHPLTAGVVALLAAGCIVAVGAVAAGGGIYYTKRGAETTIAAPIGRVFLASQRALAEMGIRQTEAELEGEGEDHEDESEGRIQGKRRGVEIKVTLKARRPRLTRVLVVAKREHFEWDKEFARAVLERIVVLAP